jgi:small subunit ribosomal protein S20
VNGLPNIKSAIKRVGITQKQNLRNRINRSIFRTSMKKFNAAIESGDVAVAEKMLPITSGAIDRACIKGVIHKNAANRRKSRISKKLQALKSAQ